MGLPGLPSEAVAEQRVSNGVRGPVVVTTVSLSLAASEPQKANGNVVPQEVAYPDNLTYRGEESRGSRGRRGRS